MKAGDKIGVKWGHIIGGAQSGNDADNPIAKSHKGPTIFYMYDAPSDFVSDAETNKHIGPRSTMQPQHPPLAKNGSRSLKTASMAPASGVSIA